MRSTKTIYIKYYSLIGQLIRKLNVLNREKKVCYGLTLPQCYTIENLGRQTQQSMKELSQDMGVSLSTMTRAVDLLVRDGFIVRKENPTDRREVRVELTRKGEEMYIKLNQCSEQYAADIINQIPSDKRKNLLESLDLLNQAIDRIKQGCCLKTGGKDE